MSSHIVVRVEAALALSELLDHENVADFVRAGLGNILKVFIKIMDEIDFEDLVKALRKIVDIFNEEIAPYAISLCQKLSQAHIRLIQSRGHYEDEDTEAGLTADGLMTAIRRVLKSISGRFPELYPKLEELLEESIKLSLTLEGESSAEDAITCVAELLYNQNEVSQRMWGVY